MTDKAGLGLNLGQTYPDRILEVEKISQKQILASGGFLT